MRFLSQCIAVSMPLLLGAGAASAQTFEGKITMRTTSDDGRTQDMQFLTKGGKIRIEMAGRGGPGVMVMDQANRKMLMMMPSQKMYMEMAIPAGVGQPPAGAASKADVTRTGKTETIAGHKCEHVLVKESAQTFDVCVAQDLGNFINPSLANPMGRGSSNDWSAKIGNGFPMRVSKGDKVMMEVTKVEPGTLDASLFTPPSDWQKMEMPGMRPPGL